MYRKSKKAKMPNWKTYESSVRLLSAIIAAHPELKLNYDGKQYIFTLSHTRAAISPFIFLQPSVKSLLPRLPPDALIEVSKKFGGGTKYKAIWDRMTKIKEFAQLINEGIEAGKDPIDVELNDAPIRSVKQGQGTSDNPFCLLIIISLYTNPAMLLSFIYQLLLQRF